MRLGNRNHLLGDITAVCRIKLARVAFLCTILSLILTACSFGAPQRAQAPPPSAAQEKSENKIPPPMQTFRALAPAEGMNFTPLFATPLKDTNQRVQRVEDAVQSLRNDFDTVVPAITRLVAVEKDIKDLIGQLKTLTDETAPRGTPPPTPALQRPKQEIPGEEMTGGTEATKAAQAAAAVPTGTPSLVTPEAASKGALPPEDAASPISLTEPPKAQAPSAAPLPAAAQPTAQPQAALPITGEIQGVRIGDHADKTRLVLDLTSKTPLKAALSEDGMHVIIDLPQTKWVGHPSWDALRGTLISGYRYADSKLTVDLMYAATIKQQDTLPSAAGGGSRFMVDLYSKDAHK